MTSEPLRHAPRLLAVPPFFCLAVAALLAAVAPPGGGAASGAGRQAAPDATANALAVVAAQPSGQAKTTADRPTLTFSRPVVALGAADPGPAAGFTMIPSIAGGWRWIGSASVEFVPQRPLPMATAFKIIVPAGLTAIDGSRLPSPYVLQFDTPVPTVLRVGPEPGSRWLESRPVFEVDVNQPVRDLARHARLEVHGTTLPMVQTREVALAADEIARANPAQRRYLERERARALPDTRTRYGLAAASELPPDTPVRLVIHASLSGTEGPLTMGSDFTAEFRTHGPLAVTSIRGGFDWSEKAPWGPARLVTTNEVDPASAKGRVRFNPEVAIEWNNVESGISYKGEPYLLLPGAFVPGLPYTVDIDAGLADRFGQVAPAYHGSLTLPDVDPELHVDRFEALLEADGDGALPVRTVNLLAMRARMWAITPEELAQAGNVVRGEQPFRRSPSIERVINVKGRRNAYRWSPVPVREALPKSARSGLVYVDLFSRGAMTEPIGAWVQISPFAVHAKLGLTSGAVWVTMLATGAPVEGAAVRVLDGAGRTVARGTTDADGVARVPGLESSDGTSGHQTVVVAEKDGQTGVAQSGWGSEITPWQFERERGGSRPVAVGFVNAERGIYRPGDTAWLKGLVRLRRNGALDTPPAGTAVHLAITDSRHNKVVTQELVTTRFGTFAAEVALPAEGALGTYAAEATLDGGGGTPLAVTGSFRVEEYRAPQFLVDVTVDGSARAAGDPLAAGVSARYLHGAPLPGAPVRWSVTRSTVDFAPPGHAGYTFGAHTWGWDDGEPQGVAALAASGEGATDARGLLAIRGAMLEAPGGRTWFHSIEAEVTDVDRQRIAGRATLLVHPAAAYAGVRAAEDGFAVAGRPVDVRLIAVAPDGAVRPGLPLRLAVGTRTWTSIRKREHSGEWITVSEPVDRPVTTCSATSAAEPSRCTFTPASPGLYRLEASVTDARGRIQKTSTWLYATGPGWVSWQDDGAQQLELVPDRAVYAVGDTARLLVKSPFPEAEALVTVEREGIVSVRRVHLSGTAGTVEVPVTDGLVPNAFVSVVLVRGRIANPPAAEADVDPGRPALRVGYAELKVEKRTRRLAVGVTVDRAQHRPRDRVTVELAVRDFQGRGALSELCVWAVDEGVLRMTGYKPVDPVESVHQERGLGVRSLDSLVALLKRRQYAEKGGTPRAALDSIAPGELAEERRRWGGGGGDAAGAELRSRFRTTAFFLPSVLTDAAGNAHVTFELPDNLSTFRILAIAAGETDRFGVGTSQVTVDKPLMALPALPRTARVGDAFEAGIAVHARPGGPDRVEVRVAADGLRVEGPAVQAVTLAAGRPREVRFRFVAEHPGTATLRFDLAGGAERDAIEQHIPVHLPLPVEAVATYGDTTDSRTEALRVPDNIRRDTGGLAIELASTVLGGYTNVISQLVEYPYGCVEQLSSRLVPFVAQRELQRAFDIAPAPVDPAARAEWERRQRAFSSLVDPAQFAIGGGTPDDVVRATVRSITALQDADGGFRYWPSSRCTSPDGSSWAVLALARARAAGYPVDEDTIAKGQRFLADRIASGAALRCPGYTGPASPEQRVFAAWALARTGQPLASVYDELFVTRDRLPVYARAMLADAMLAGGDSGQGRKLLDGLLAGARVTEGEVHFEEAAWAGDWSSDARSTAIVMMVLAGRSPDHPYVARLARWLARARDGAGAYRTTQEAAFTLLALADLLRTKEKDVPDFTATVRLGGGTVAEGTFHGRSAEVTRAGVPMDKLGAKEAPLVVAKSGAGVLYYTATLRYVPAAVDLQPLDRGIVVQRAFEPWSGNAAPKTAFDAGELVRVRVRVATPSERHFVAIEVPLPAGFEIVDTSLETTARPAGTVPEAGGPATEGEGSEGEDESASPWATGFWTPFNHRERRDDRLVLFADRLPPGVSEYTVAVRATTPGAFVVPPAHAAEMYAPEVSGRSASARVTIAPVADAPRR